MVLNHNFLCNTKFIITLSKQTDPSLYGERLVSVFCYDGNPIKAFVHYIELEQEFKEAAKCEIIFFYTSFYVIRLAFMPLFKMLFLIPLIKPNRKCKPYTTCKKTTNNITRIMYAQIDATYSNR